MTITVHQVHKIADLAKLNLSNDAASMLSKQLESILALIEKMNSVDTAHISPVFHSLETSLPFRTDEVTEKNQREVFQKIAPSVEAGLYLVPKVIE